MRNRIINLGVVAEIAQALGDLNESVVFVGGAVISIYADDPAADEVRPTQDVDLNRTTIVEEVRVADKRIRDFLKSEFRKILNTPYAEEILAAHVHPLILEKRYPILLAKINDMLA